MTEPATNHRAAGEHGFSLMEMLVSLVILALILALLPGAFRLARQVWTATAMLDRESGRDAGLDFLDTRLAEAMPLFEPGKAGLVNILFSGSKDAIAFVAPSRNGPAGGGTPTVRWVSRTSAWYRASSFFRRSFSFVNACNSVSAFARRPRGRVSHAATSPVSPRPSSW